MKKIICAILLLVLTLFLIACENGYSVENFNVHKSQIPEGVLEYSEEAKLYYYESYYDFSVDTHIILLDGSWFNKNSIVVITLMDSNYNSYSMDKIMNGNISINREINSYNKDTFVTIILKIYGRMKDIDSHTISFLDINNIKESYSLNDILGLNTSGITKIEYSITSDPNDVVYNADIEETFSKLNVEYNRIDDNIDLDILGSLASYYIYNGEEVIYFNWLDSKVVFFEIDSGRYFSNIPVELLTINEYNQNVKYANSLFNLEEEKNIWKGSIEDDFTDDTIILVLKHSDLFPELELKHFGLDEGSALYLSTSTPPDYYFEPGYEDELNNYHQIVVIYIEPKGKEKVIELIKRLEKINFILSVTPNEYGTYDGIINE